MSEAISVRVVDELKAIKKDLDYIKKNMVDVDNLLTKEEEKRLEKSLKEYKKGKATPLHDFKKEVSS